MTKNIIYQALVKFICGVVIIGLLVFLPAGSIHYWQGWVLMCTMFVPIAISGMIMLWRSPELLIKRLRSKEKEKEQKFVLWLSGIMFVCMFILAGLNHRFALLPIPDSIVWGAVGVYLLGYALYAEVLRENIYLSRIIEVTEGQQLISTGLYSVVRHPMYSSTLLMFLSMPLILGSPLSFLVMLAYLPIIHLRIKNEEKILEKGLAGYVEYKRVVKYKIVPYLW